MVIIEEHDSFYVLIKSYSEKKTIWLLIQQIYD